jgi:hypothetical protein
MAKDWRIERYITGQGWYDTGIVITESTAGKAVKEAIKRNAPLKDYPKKDVRAVANK